MTREAVYCNTCFDYPLEDAATPGGPNPGRAKCGVRQQLYAWDSRACMFYVPVSHMEREKRRVIVIELYKREKELASAEAKDPAQAGK